MAKIKGKATVSEDGYKNLHCPFCGRFLKLNIGPENGFCYSTCDRCRTKINAKPNQNGKDVFKVNMCMWTATD